MGCEIRVYVFDHLYMSNFNRAIKGLDDIIYCPGTTFFQHIHFVDLLDLDGLISSQFPLQSNFIYTEIFPETSLSTQFLYDIIAFSSVGTSSAVREKRNSNMCISILVNRWSIEHKCFTHYLI